MSESPLNPFTTIFSTAVWKGSIYNAESQEFDTEEGRSLGTEQKIVELDQEILVARNETLG